jgi:hypothetical protein
MKYPIVRLIGIKNIIKTLLIMHCEECIVHYTLDIYVFYLKKIMRLIVFGDT